MFRKIKKIHFVGIGGSGMSGIAQVLISLGYQVTGSDLKRTEVTDHLKDLGAKIFIGHKSENVGKADVVVISSAVDSSNVEVRYAVKNKIPVIPRVEMLSELARLKYTITIAGTHGKTTTTSLTSLVLEHGGLDPTVIIGGRLKNIKSGAKLGKGDFLVAEADESDGSFLKLSPTITVITNIDNDHLDYYKTFENIKLAFKEHINKVPFYGCAIICSDDENITRLMPQIKRKFYTYGLKNTPDFLATDVKYTDNGSSFKVRYKDKDLGSVFLNLAGDHNIKNALASIAVGIELGVSFSDIAKALEDFGGVGRRLELKGEKNDIMVLDDYGHHPTEIKVTLDTIKKNWPKRRLIVLFQPHRYSRTAFLYNKFGPSFKLADEVKLLEVYPAGEKPITGISSRLIYNSMKGNKKNIDFYSNVDYLIKQLKPGDIVLTLGAGDVWKIGEQILKRI